VLADAGCNIVDSQQYGNPASGRFFMRVAVSTQLDQAELQERLQPVAASFGMEWGLHREGAKMRTLLMASKSAHCLNHLLFLQRLGTLPIEIPAIVSNHTDLAGLAQFYGIPFHHIPVAADTKEQAEQQLRKLVAEHDIELVVLARYMQILATSCAPTCRARRSISTIPSCPPSRAPGRTTRPTPAA